MYTELPEGDKNMKCLVPPDVRGGVHYPWSQHLYDFDVACVLEVLAVGLGMEQMESYAGPRIVAVFKPGECMIGTLRPDLISISRVRFIEPEEETWALIEKAWAVDDDWGGREKAIEDGWFIREIKGGKKISLEESQAFF